MWERARYKAKLGLNGKMTPEVQQRARSAPHLLFKEVSPDQERRSATSRMNPWKFEVESKTKGISLHLLAKELDLTFYSSRSGVKKRGESPPRSREKL